MYTVMKKYPQDATLFNENELHMELLVIADLLRGGALIKTLHVELCMRIIPKSRLAPNASYLHILQVSLHWYLSVVGVGRGDFIGYTT